MSDNDRSRTRDVTVHDSVSVIIEVRPPCNLLPSFVLESPHQPLKGSFARRSTLLSSSARHPSKHQLSYIRLDQHSTLPVELSTPPSYFSHLLPAASSAALLRPQPCPPQRLKLKVSLTTMQSSSSPSLTAHTAKRLRHSCRRRERNTSCWSWIKSVGLTLLRLRSSLTDSLLKMTAPPFKMPWKRLLHSDLFLTFSSSKSTLVVTRTCKVRREN